MTPEVVTSITSAVDFSSVVVGLGAVGSAIAVVLIAHRGLKMLLSSIRS